MFRLPPPSSGWDTAAGMTALLPPKCYPTECDQVLRLTRMNLVPQGFLLCPALTVSGLLRLLLISGEMPHTGTMTMHILWTIIIGFIVGVVAKFLMPGKNEPSGFILTVALGIAGAFVATYLGQAVGWYGPGESAGFIGGVVGAIIVLAVYGFFAGRRAT